MYMYMLVYMSVYWKIKFKFKKTWKQIFFKVLRALTSNPRGTEISGQEELNTK